MTRIALLNLIYVSSARVELDAGELIRILESAVRYNVVQHITGLLLYMNGSFMQALEGEDAAVDETWSRIQRDPRHTGFVEIVRGPIEARSFGRWSMGFRHVQATDLDSHPAFTPFFRFGFDASSLGAREGLALDLLREFALGQGL